MASISLKLGINLLYPAKVLYQFVYRKLLSGWWRKETAWAFAKTAQLAIIGSRGPCNAGGVETVCHHLYQRLVKEFDVLVYSRSPYIASDVQRVDGIPVKHLPTINQPGLEAFFHSFLSTLHAMLSPAQIIHYHAQGPALFSILPRIFTPWKKVIFTCHALDWQRAKWGSFASSLIRLGEWVSARFPHKVTTVSYALAYHYEKMHGIRPTVIPNGTVFWDVPESSAQELSKLGIEPNRYLLFLGRLVPEKAVHELIEAFESISQQERNGFKLVIAGGDAGAGDYADKLMASASEEILFTGFVSGDVLKSLYSGAWAFISPSHLEGFNITVIEALSCGMTPPLTQVLPVFRRKPIPIKHSIAKAFRRDTEHPHLH